MNRPQRERISITLDALAGIDIYVLDQIMRGRLTADMRILDVGCGAGRNVALLMASGADVCGVDLSPEAIDAVRTRAATLGMDNVEDRFGVGEIAALPHDDNSFDAVICCAVLHFARNELHFDNMITTIRRVLRPGGLFIARLASLIGIETQVQPLGEGQYKLPDGTTRFLVSEDDLLHQTERIGGELLDPIKTTVVHNLRCMTTWCVRLV